MTAAADLPFACACGAVEGRIRHPSPRRGSHVVCHCRDCQSLPVYLGCTERILGEANGTALYQARCTDLMLDRGKDRLACLHLTGKPTLRWYAACCKTPLFNTFANGKLPYTTILLANCDDQGRAALSEPLGHLFLKDAPSDTTGLEPVSIWPFVLSSVKRIALDIMSGARTGNPLFHPETLEPIATPYRLYPAERTRLQYRVRRPT